MIREPPLFHALAAGNVEHAQRGVHAREIEFAPKGARMRQDAAIGDQQPAIRQPGYFVRVDPARIDLSGDFVVAGVAYCDHTARLVVVMLGSQQPVTVE